MKDPRDVIIRPIFTEKALNAQKDANAYVFEVAIDATKHDIRRAVEELFKVRVTKVNTVILKGKPKRRIGQRLYGRTKRTKKAYVFLKEGDSITLFEGV